MATQWTSRIKPITSYNTRVWLKSDLWYWLNELWSIMTNENWARILFNTWDFVIQNTKWNSRILPS